LVDEFGKAYSEYVIDTRLSIKRCQFVPCRDPATSRRIPPRRPFLTHQPLRPDYLGTTQRASHLPRRLSGSPGDLRVISVNELALPALQGERRFAVRNLLTATNPAAPIMPVASRPATASAEN